MSRIATPETIEAAPEASQPILRKVRQQLGVLPNMFRMVSNSPAALEGYLGLASALAKGALPSATRQRIAIAIAQFDGCDYCMSAHTFLGKNVDKLSDTELEANRGGHSTDPKADAAVQFARKVAEQRGAVSDADLNAVRAAGYDDGQIVEIVQNVALNILTNYLNVVAQTVIDFPVVHTRAVA
ncbi:carboxymuconolactone decarboxylase family protein [Paraburkholderia sp. DHOC27]|uniref:carboxymuconolactone decarboxylase family protein n=1 Tax=Paraburkholderia sp. DHOC27 TaxID=2303330 RepID=UPI000E3B919D|nr:carboxymuconolactone decarboxylase family protein [Paraburkholderia sp. DHOC27]RFU49679.1 carboxymuconolactone decarboxylase family protein [Paraburkholderia sp. DHOC27]